MRQNSIPKISVLMAVRNGEPYLRSAVESVLRQTFIDFEFVIVDDASSDHSWDVLQSFASQDERMVLLRNTPSGGLAKALNKGLAQARGEYVARMDADDVSLPERFARQIDFLDQHRNVAVLGTAAQYFDESGPSQSFLRYPTTSDKIKHELLSHSPIIHPSVTMRRKPLLDAGGYREAFLHAQDYDLWLRLAESWDLANLDDILLGYRKHPAQATRAKACSQVLSALGARFSANMRRSTGRDPVATVQCVDHSALLAIGVPPQEIERTLTAGPMRQAMERLHEGNAAEARQLIEEILRLLSSQVSSRKVRSELALLLGKTYLAEQDLRNAAYRIIQACLLEPRGFFRLARATWSHLFRQPGA